ncbi:hypothetical protein GGH94_000715 [Coemansia aciculifera]|uniref:Uncharacterized protein n=1 Tax=Coemansia aciculifera TaxID=417176 RepID=A0A9W8M8W3_9FUNG|nr:hypothetical protein GGH94_000715 [Coemansia aciculifera]
MYGETTEIAGARLAAIILSTISAIASLVVVISYVRMLLQFRAHQRRIIEASMGAGGGGVSAVPPAACFSCESSLATPGVNKTHFFSPQNRPVRQLNGSISGLPIQNSIPMQTVLSSGIPALNLQRSSMPPLPHTLQGTAASMRTRTSSRATSCSRLVDVYSKDDGDVGSYHSKSHSIAVAAALTQSTGNADTFRGWAKHYHQPPKSRVPPLTLQPLSIATDRKPQYQYQPQRHTSLENSASPPIDISQPPRRLLVPGRELLSRMLPRRRKDRSAGAPAVLDIFGSGRRKRKLPRIPSSKIAVLSGIDFLLHTLWIVNTTAADGVGGCTASLFFYQWIQLFYLFFLAAFASRSAMRLRNLQPIQPRKQRRTDMIYSCSTLAASLALSVLPAIMATAQHDDELNLCWFARGTSISLRWVWVTLNIWVILSLLFLIATSIYVGVILSNERRDLMSFIMHPSTAAAAAAVQAAANSGSAEHIKTTDSTQMPSFYHSSMSAPGARHSQMAAGVPTNYYYHNRSNQVVAADAPPNISGNNIGTGIAATTFGARSTSLASRESLGLSRGGGNETSPGAGTGTTPATGNGSGAGSKCRPAPLMIYPPNHPVALAHEALHGRRPITSRSRDSALVSSECLRHTTGNSMAAHRTAQSHMPQYPDIPQYSGRTSSSGRNSNCESCKRCSVSSQDSGGVHSERSMRHHSEIISAARYYSLSRQQWSNAGLSRPGSSIADNKMQYHRPLSSGLVYMTGLANDSESSRISAAHPWDSSRRLIHKHSYASTTAAAAAPQTQKASPLAVEHRPLYGFYAQRSVAASAGGRGSGQKCRRMAKHMSMPVPSGAVGSHAYSTSSVEQEHSEASAAAYMATRHARQLSMPQDASHQQQHQSSRQSGATFAQGRWYGSQPFNANSGEAAAPLGLLPKPSLAHIGGTAKTTSGGIGLAVHMDLQSGKPANSSAAAKNSAKTRKAQRRGLLGWFIGGLFSGSHKGGGKRSETQGQMQRIERRVHMLVATGALRVATRAMVPLVTQLCMVVWSTLHSINASDGVLTKVYAAAILLLSTQGLLDMALYHFFDTQADNSNVSLPSGIPLSSYNNAGSSSGGSGGKAPNSFAPHSQHRFHHQSSLVYLHADVVYTPRASHDRRPSSNWHDPYYHHHRQHNYQQQPQAQQQYPQSQQQLPQQLQQPHGHHRLSAEGKHRTMNPGAPSHHHSRGRSGHHHGGRHHQRSISLTSVGSADRRFVFNVDSLNIRRADRTSNAMQSDTLHDGSDCVAWSHMDALSAHDASSISQFSASGPHVQHHHQPVLSGWEEADLEESPRSSAVN